MGGKNEKPLLALYQPEVLRGLLTAVIIVGRRSEHDQPARVLPSRDVLFWGIEDTAEGVKLPVGAVTATTLRDWANRGVRPDKIVEQSSDSGALWAPVVAVGMLVDEALGLDSYVGEVATAGFREAAARGFSYQVLWSATRDVVDVLELLPSGAFDRGVRNVPA